VSGLRALARSKPPPPTPPPPPLAGRRMNFVETAPTLPKLSRLVMHSAKKQSSAASSMMHCTCSPFIQPCLTMSTALLAMSAVLQPRITLQRFGIYGLPAVAAAHVGLMHLSLSLLDQDRVGSTCSAEALTTVAASLSSGNAPLDAGRISALSFLL